MSGVKLPDEFSHFGTSPYWRKYSSEEVEAIVRDCAHAAWMALGGASHKVSENSEIYRAQDHALAMASKAILARYGLKEE